MPPSTILCKVLKRSTWVRPSDNTKFKSITLDAKPGRYFCFGDEDTEQFVYTTFSITICADVPAFFDNFEVGQEVELEIRAKL